VAFEPILPGLARAKARFVIPAKAGIQQKTIPHSGQNLFHALLFLE
jgi:hypothetical protein